MDASKGHEVKLAIYDLSNGREKAISERILGFASHAVDMIPHSGLVVYGMLDVYGMQSSQLSVKLTYLLLPSKRLIK